MENIDPLDRKVEYEQQKEDHSQVQQPIIKREVDSLDDFEHLGHDDNSSPLKEQQKTEDLLDLRTESPAGEVQGVINKGGEFVKAATKFTDDQDDDDDFMKRFDRTVQDERGAVDYNKMDSNLLQMGDTTQKEDKLDKFLSDFSSTEKSDVEDKKKTEIEKEFGDFKSATKNFMDMEREFIQPVKSDVLDRYSDSESDTEQPKQSINADVKTQPSKTETSPFQDTDYLKSTIPELSKPSPPSCPPPAPPQNIPIVPTPKPTVESLEDVKPQTKKVEPSAPPAPKIEKTKSDIIAAEAMFCKMGLGEFMHEDL